METSIIGIFFALLLCVVLSGFFSAAETAFSAANRIRLKNLAASGNKRAERTYAILENYDKLLSTLLIGNNIVNITAASLGTVFFTTLIGSAGVTVSTIVITLVILVFSEISPKSIAKEFPERVAMFATPMLRFFMVLFAPLNAVFSAWKKVLKKVVRHGEEPAMIEEEIITMVSEAETDGDMDAQEGELIRSAIEFRDLDAQDILTPRVDVTGLDDEATMEEAAETFRDHGFSRLPVYHESMDDIIGILHEKDFYAGVHRGEKCITAMMKPPVHAPATLKISKLLQLLQGSKTHMAVLVDEFGGTAGIVTLEDVLEELVGEIYDEHDDVTVEVQPTEDGRLLVEGGADLEDILEMLDIDKTYEADTVGGWVAEETGSIPTEGECFTVDGVEVTVVKVDKRRVVQVCIKPRALPENAESA